MPTYTMTGPDGKDYSIDGPSGATQDQVITAIKSQLAASPQQADDPNHEGKAQGQRILNDASQYAREFQGHPINALIDGRNGLGEAALNLATGVGSSVVGGLAGLGRAGYGLLKGDDFDTAMSHAADTSQSIQQAATYQPRTAAGKLYTELASVPLNAASEGARSIGGGIGQFVNGDQGRIAGEEIGGATPAIVATLAGGAAALRRPGAALAADQPVVADTPDVNMIRNANTEAPQSAVTNRYDASGQRIIHPEPVVSQPVADTSDVTAEPVLYRIPRQTEGGNLPIDEQTARAQVLQRIGLEQARESAISGDSAEGATQSQIARFTDSPAGLAAKDMFDGERAALQDHAKSIVSDTGGSLGTDESTLNARGQIIAAPFDGLRQYFDSAIKNLYTAADEQSGGKPLTQLDGLSDFIDKKSNFSGKGANSSLGNGLSHYLEEQGIMDSNGVMRPVTPMEAEGIKQYINGQWSPDTSGLAGTIKNVIDNDVFKGAGGDIYADARNMYKMKKATLDNPNGVASLMDYDPQTPINRTTPFEKMPDRLTGLPAAQFGHIIDTLNKILDPQYNTPPLLQLQAIDALNEIKGHMANGLLDAGSKFASKWNAPGVTQYLKNNSAKFPMVFGRDAIGKIRDLNDAGHILSVDKSYPGAAVQATLAVKRGLLPQIAGKSLAGVGGLTGSFAGPIGATAGAAVGSAAGESIASAIGGKAALNKFNQGIVNLKDYTNPKIVQPAAPVSHLAPRINVPRSSALKAEIAVMSNRNQQRQTIQDAQNVDQAISAFTQSVPSISAAGTAPMLSSLPGSQSNRQSPLQAEIDRIRRGNGGR